MEWTIQIKQLTKKTCLKALHLHSVQRFSRAGPRGRARECATLGVHPLSWLLSNNRLEEVCGTLTKGTFSSRLLLSNQDKGCTPSVAHSLPLPLPPGFCSSCQVSYLHIQIPTTGYVGLIWRSTTEVTVSCWSTTEGTLQLLHARYSCHSSCSVPSTVLQLAVASVVLRHMRLNYET